VNVALVSRAALETPQPPPDEEAVESPAQAAAVPTPPVGGHIVLAAFAILGLGLAGSWLLWTTDANAAMIRPAETGTVFVGLLVFAAAVERLIDPFTRWMPGRSARAALERVRAAAANRAGRLGHQDLVAVAEAEALAARAQATRTVLMWGVASAVATLISSLCGFYVLHGIAGPGWDAVPVWADALVTGVLVGSGSKPVHDLITRAQTKP